ncbi:maleylacetate reductase [Cryobacterium sp. TMT2-42-4]|uniref:maleylacetate reductase n=1 Tax=Cryobacterium sp. TMT2-42-4 TaxID=1259255 RepID=UPI001F53F776|nr:maleylacetate reductase [Cryobacterium sp. TMT2-42-4]
MREQPVGPGLDFEYRTQRQRVLFGTGRAGELLAEVLGKVLGEQPATVQAGGTGTSTGSVIAPAGIAGASGTPGAPRVMVIATRRELERSAAVLAGIRSVLVFDEIVQHVPAESAERAHRAAQAARIDVVVALGGGSAIGLAKILALRSERTGGLPIVAVPTTYSGSEATAVWGLVENGVKTTGFDLRVLPGTVIYDADLTLSLPRELSVSSALNALAHGVDALWAPGANPVSALLAAEGIRMLAHALPRIAVAPGAGPRTAEAAGSDTSGSDPVLGGGGIHGAPAGRKDALYGAYLSASAFSSAGSGLHHTICHVLGGTFGLPHAQTHAIVLPHVVALNAPAATEAEAQIAAALGSCTAVEGLLALRDSLHAPTALRDFGFQESDIARAVALILPAVPASNPRAVTPDDLTLLLRNAWSGAAPGGR